MLKITIESTNPFAEEENNIDISAITDSNKNSDSTATEFIEVFIRAMMGMSFTEQTILNCMKEIIECEEEKE